MSEAPDDPFGLVGTTLEKRFAIDRVVARGGFGVVYQGRQITLKKTVAIKVLMMPAGLGIEEKRVFLHGFEQEAQTIAALEHPAIVRAYDFGIARPAGRRELPWLALEWIEGESLEQRIASLAGQRMSPAEVLALLRPVLQGLAFAHARHVAHRDLKPANIMLSPSEVQPGAVNARLLDFGIAKVMSPDEVVGSGATRTMAVFSAFSTPYASPEQKTGRKTGPWTDVHAMGLIITELLTGSAPYPGEDPVAVELRILSPDRPTPARFGVNVGAWEPVLAKAVSLNPPDRFADAGAFLTALEASLASTAPSPPTTAAVAPAPPPPAELPAQPAVAFAATEALSIAAPAAPGFVPPAPGYTAPTPGYTAPAPGYTAPTPGYTAPAPGYTAPAPGYAPPALGYTAPASGYTAPAPGYTAPTPGYTAPAAGFAPPAPTSNAKTYATIAAVLLALILASCVLCVAFAPSPKDNAAAPTGQPSMTPIPAR
ncbi:MAG: protein kinase [Polyangiales bacterium]